MVVALLLTLRVHMSIRLLKGSADIKSKGLTVHMFSPLVKSSSPWEEFCANYLNSMKRLNIINRKKEAFQK